MVAYVIIAIIAYLIGSISFSVIISKKMAGFDVREKGSGNAGTTNMLRSAGKGLAALTLICDILKGVVAVLVAFWIGKIATRALALYRRYEDLTSGIVFVIFANTIIYFFANNNYFNGQGQSFYGNGFGNNIIF